MTRKAKLRASLKTGLPPGALVHVGRESAAPLAARMIRYNRNTVEEAPGIDPAKPLTAEGMVSWIDLTGLHHVEAIGAITERFGLHPLAVEDILNTDQRPKAENIDGTHLLFILKTLRFDTETGVMAEEQVSVVLGKGGVLTFRESESPLFDTVAERIRRGAGRIRSMGADYLAHALLDVIVDHYFVAGEALVEATDTLEEEAFADERADITPEIKRLRRAGTIVRRAVWPLRDLYAVVEAEEELVAPETLPYYRDLSDHLTRMLEIADHQRETLAAAFDAHLSRMSHRLNEAMRVLTVIATLFIPLTFVAGVYGMNFRYMPELKSRWGYPGVLLAMALVAAGMFVWFRKRRWF